RSHRDPLRLRPPAAPVDADFFNSFDDQDLASRHLLFLLVLSWIEFRLGLLSNPPPSIVYPSLEPSFWNPDGRPRHDRGRRDHPG
ncbi:unnamed protein product, partial [Musa textilis]